MVWDVTLFSLGQLSWLCPLPVSCPLPDYLFAGDDCAGEKTMMLYKHWSVIAKTLVCSQCCSSNKSRTQHHTYCYDDN